MIELSKLKRGDIISNSLSGNSYIIIETNPLIVAIRSVIITNSDERIKINHKNFVNNQ